MIKKHFWKIFIVVAVLFIGGAFVYSNQITEQANEGVTFESHVKGNPDAEVTLTKYSDFQCPACAQFSTVVDEVLLDHGDQVRFEYKHFPLTTIHPNAVAAGRAAEAAGQQGEFFAMHDILFDEQQTWGPSANPQAYFTQYAEDIGLDIELFNRHMRASVIRDKVMDEYNEARQNGFTGTPTFLLNGELMQYTTFQDFIDEIDAAVAEASGATSTEATTTEAEASAEADVQFGI